MRLGIPTLCRYDLLQLLLDSAERGTVKPDGYLIVDNGGKANDILRLPPNAEVIEPGRNLGVAASWNRMLDMAGDEPIVISNDDVVFGPETFERFARAITEEALLVGSVGRWATIFAQAPECTRQIGYYDENFYPAYYEDRDYERRCGLAGVARIDLDVDHEHVVSGTLKSLPGMTNGVDCDVYYAAKWGGLSGAERYAEPFNGSTPPGWTLRAPATPWRPKPYSIIDYIYGRGGATG